MSPECHRLSPCSQVTVCCLCDSRPITLVRVTDTEACVSSRAQATTRLCLTLHSATATSAACLGCTGVIPVSLPLLQDVLTGEVCGGSPVLPQSDPITDQVALRCMVVCAAAILKSSMAQTAGHMGRRPLLHGAACLERLYDKPRPMQVTTGPVLA